MGKNFWMHCMINDLSKKKKSPPFREKYLVLSYLKKGLWVICEQLLQIICASTVKGTKGFQRRLISTLNRVNQRSRQLTLRDQKTASDFPEWACVCVQHWEPPHTWLHHAFRQRNALSPDDMCWNLSNIENCPSQHLFKKTMPQYSVNHFPICHHHKHKSTVSFMVLLPARMTWITSALSWASS